MLQEQFPTMPEAATAKAEIEKGGARLGNIVTELKNEQAEADKQFKGEAAKQDDTPQLATPGASAGFRRSPKIKPLKSTFQTRSARAY